MAVLIRHDEVYNYNFLTKFYLAVDFYTEHYLAL